MKKLLGVGAFLLAFCMLVGCARIEHNAVIVDSGLSYKEQWLENNYTYGAYQSWNDGYDESLPESRTYLITEQAALDETFDSFPKIDFEKEMVLVYCYTTVYVRDRVLEKAVLDGDVLTVEFNVVRGKLGHADAASPQTRVLTVKMDKLDVTEVKVVYNGQ